MHASYQICIPIVYQVSRIETGKRQFHDANL